MGIARHGDPGNLETFTNRTGASQTFRYDERNRAWRFDWSDGTSWQQTVYDAASRVTHINNDASEIEQFYYDDNRLEREATRTTAFGGNPLLRTVAYTYDLDGNRETIQYHGGESFSYDYTHRNQLWKIRPTGQSARIIEYSYDRSGNVIGISRDNGTSTGVAPDDLNRVTRIDHNFVSGGQRSFDYAYNEVNNVRAVRRDEAAGDGFEYDKSRQIKGFQRDGTFPSWPPPVTNPVSNPANDMAIEFDGCGNRKSVLNSNPGLVDISYAVNDLNQYSEVSESGPVPTPTPPPGATPTPTPPPTVTPTPTPGLPTPTVPPITPTPTPPVAVTPTPTPPLPTSTPTPPPVSPTPIVTPTPTPSSPTPTPTPPSYVAEPACNPPDGQIYFTQGSKTISVATATEGAQMRYTFGSTLPTSTTGTLIAAHSGTVQVTPTTEGRTLNVIAFKEGMDDSTVHSATYYYENGNVPQLPDEEWSSDLVYDRNGNLTRYKEWVYTYDAQNRLRLVWNENENVLVAEYYYDGKNRQIARNLNGAIRFSVWDGWELIEEWSDGATRSAGYLQGATGVIKSWGNNGTFYYYQDKLGSTTHIANASGTLLEGYRYDLYGAPTYYEANGQLKATQASGHGIVDLYAGGRWMPILGLYDLRNRFMSSELGRFLQADPIGFKGDASNLYRYCGNDSVNKTDPDGLISIDATWSRLMYWQGNALASFNDIADAYRNWQPPGMGENGGGGGPKSGPSEGEVRNQRENAKPQALSMLREVARGSKDQTGEIVLQNGEIRRASPVEERYVKTNPFFPSSPNRMARENLKTGGRALWIVHYHRRGGDEKFPTPDDYAAMKQEKAPMMFTSRHLAKEGHYQILREGSKPQTLYDRQLYLEHHNDDLK